MEENYFNRNKYIFTSVPPIMLVNEEMDNTRSEQIALFLKELSIYEVFLKDLINIKLKEDERNIALNIAYFIANNEEISAAIIKNKNLSIDKLKSILRVKQTLLDKLREYIIAYFVVLKNHNYKSIQDYLKIKIKQSKEKKDYANINNKKDNNVYAGLVLKVNKHSIDILTCTGIFIKVKKSKVAFLGQVYQGREMKGLRYLKINMAIAIVLLIFICSGIVIQYNKVKSTIIIGTTSSIKLNINSFNKVIYVHSPTEKGTDLIDSLNLVNKDIDTAVEEIFDYAANNNMISEDKKVLITISGDSLNYGTFNKTNKFTTENNINLIINNSGNQQTLPKYIEDGETN